MSRLAADHNNYEETKKCLLGLGLEVEVINYLDRLENPKKEKLTAMLIEIVQDETLHALALVDKDIFKEFMDLERSRKRGTVIGNVIPFPLS